MTPLFSGSALLICFVALSACKGEDNSKDNNDKGAGVESKTAAPSAAKPAAAPSSGTSFAGFATDDVVKALQGNWVFKAGIHKEAWSVKGDTVLVYEKGVETKASLSVKAPCLATVSVTSAGGGTSGTVTQLIAHDGKILFGPASLGLKRGDTTLLCSSNQVYTFTGGKCTWWKKDMFEDTYKAAEGKCGPSPAGEGFFQTTDKTDYTYELEPAGNLLKTQHAVIHEAMKFATFEEAKKKLDE